MYVVSRSTRVLVLNNYPLDEVWEEVRRGEKPDHHLFGINHFGALGYEVRIVPFAQSQALQWLERMLTRVRFPIPLGALDRQWSGWRLLREADLIYAPCGNETTLLSYLRSIGLLSTPIVSLQHHALNRGRMASLREPWIRRQIRGTDALPALSRQVADEVNARNGSSSKKSCVLPWGPDATFYPSTDTAGEGVVAAGRTGRDFLAFGRAASEAQCPAEIICMEYDVRPEFGEFAANVKITTPKSGGVFTYPEMMQQLLTARVLAIPLFDDPGSLAGLTSLLDAIGLGKPVIMTRHPLIDVDIEALGIGRWVEPNDVVGWRDAIRWFDAHPAESREMGRHARALVDDGNFHSGEFASRMVALFDAVLNRKPSEFVSHDAASFASRSSGLSTFAAGPETTVTSKWTKP